MSANNSAAAGQATIALVSARAAAALDEDLPPLQAALQAAGVAAQVVNWDDPDVDWRRFDLALLRSTWDYVTRLDEFLRWAQRCSAQTRLCNPLPLVRWNIDKHYLVQLAAAGVAVVPSQFVEPGDDAADALRRFRARAGRYTELVVKPAIGAGSRDAQRHGCDETAAVVAHIERLLSAGRSVLLQPYLARVDEYGETALIFFAGRFSHAIRKGPLLRRGAALTTALFAPEEITPRQATPAELALADKVVAAVPLGPPLYARVDLIGDAGGAPCVLELELTEPSLFFAQAPGAAQRFTAAILAERQTVR
jgi:O-ureido-D-serine cyclo-ligase